MMVWFVLSPIFLVIGLMVSLRYYRRALATISLRDLRLLQRLPETKVSELKPGLVRLVGVAQAEQGVMSYFERQPCVLHRRAVTTISGRERVGNVTYTQTFTSQEWTAIPFQLDDGTGKIWVDPRIVGTRVDYEEGTTDEANPVQEQFIRLGDKVSVVGEIEMLPDSDGYRARARTNDVAEYARFKGPVLVSWRSDAEFLPNLTPPLPAVALAAFGLGGLILATFEGQLALVAGLSTASVVMGLMATGFVLRFAR